MANYFRITAYHPAKNVCAIFDSNGRRISSRKALRSSKSVRTTNSSTGTSQRLPRANSSSYAPAQRGSPSSMAIPLR